MKQTSFFLRPMSRLAVLSALAPTALAVSLALGGCGGGSSVTLPTPANYRLAATLDYSAVSQNSNAFIARVETLSTTGGNFSGELVNRAGAQNANFSGINRIVNNPNERFFSVQLASPAGRPFVVGQVIPLALGTQSNILLRQSNVNFNGDRIWNSDGGTATVTAIGADSIAVRLDNARFVPSSAFLGTGTFLLNGPLSATGLRVVTG